MNYSEIVSQIARKLGWEGLEGSLKTDIQYAINWAESEILSAIGGATRSDVCTIKSDQSEYDIKRDFGIKKFSEPCSITFYDSDGARLEAVETTYEQWVKWSPSNNTDTDVRSGENENLSTGESSETAVEMARFSNKVVYAIRYIAGSSGQSSGYFLFVKPIFTGTAVFVYNVQPNDEVFDDLTAVPVLPEQFSRYIVPGAVQYLSQIEQAKAIRAKRLDVAQLMGQITAQAASEFKLMKAKAIEKSKPSFGTAIAQTFQWYDNPRKYR